MISLSKILVPTDHSDTSLKALDYALEFARAYQAEVYLLTVVDERYMTYMSLTAEDKNSSASLEDKMVAHMNRELDSIIASKKAGNVKIIKKILTGHPSEEIIRFSDDINADLIILGTHGHSGVSRMLIGSVAERVVRRAKRPVLVVRRDEHEFVAD